ncbi:MAG: PAS domain S-box protein [Betaproteobacteria bacterium]|nr:PAS domain S-box protein [Betaproteobacteria bacterium]
MWLLPRRLNTRIILKVSCILLATGIAFGWMNAREQTASLLATMRLNSSIMVRNFAESCARYLLVQDYAELESFLLKSADLPDILRLQVCEPNGALLWNVERGPDGQTQAKTGIARLVPPSSQSAVIAMEDNVLVIWQPIVAGSLLGWIKADFGLSTIHEAQSTTWRNTIFLVIIWIIGNAFLIVLVLSPIVQSIGRLTAFSKQLDEHKGTQISVGDQPLEIAELGRSMNEASVKLLSTEQQLLDEQARLRESEEMYRSLVTSMAEGVVFQAVNGEITAVNPAAERIEGRSFAQMISKTPEEAQWTALYENGQPFPGELHPAMVTLRTGEPQVDVIMGIHRPDGELVWISVNSQPLIAAGDTRPYAVVTTFHDITERKQAEEKLMRANADLQRFAEVTAHHLQEPARRMANYAERLITQLGARLDDAEAQLSLEFISQQARREQILLRDVERYLASDQPRSKVESVDVRQAVARILEQLRNRIKVTGAEIVLNNLPPCRIDLPRLNDIFTVALENALTHGRSQHPLYIEIAGERQDNKVRYSISDNGPGVEMQYRERVFRVFERLSADDAEAGTGIGLAILRRVVESCDGRAWIDETLGGGCRLLFELPAGEPL